MLFGLVAVELCHNLVHLLWRETVLRLWDLHQTSHYLIELHVVNGVSHMLEQYRFTKVIKNVFYAFEFFISCQPFDDALCNLYHFCGTGKVHHDSDKDGNWKIVSYY